MQIRTPAEDQALSARNMLIALALLVGLTVWVWIVGSNFRVIYLGPGSGSFSEGVLVRTDPELSAIVTRSEFAKLKAGCRYDFNYAPKLGKGSGKHNYSFHVARSVTLVDCP